jgi:hypothetical protein
MEIASRVGLELKYSSASPAVRVFDARSATAQFSRVMRSMHDRFPTTPFISSAGKSA